MNQFFCKINCIILFIGVALNATQVFAATTRDACDSLYEFSCSAGDLEDGTGISLSRDSLQEKIKLKSKRLHPIYTQYFFQALQSNLTGSEIFRESALKATLQKNSLDCISQTPNDLSSCNQRMAEIMATDAIKRIFNIQFIVQWEPGDKSYDELRGNKIYWDALTSADQQSFAIVSENTLEQKVRDEIFPRVKKIFIDKLKSYKLHNENLKDSFIKKVENISYLGNNYSLFLKNISPTMTGLMNAGATYSPSLNSFVYGNDLLFISSSEFPIIFYIAHELAHSIDPCFIDEETSFKYDYNAGSTLEDLEKQNPFHHVISCLRTKQSVGAIHLSDTRENNLNKNPLFLNDQITESFADWMAGEILPAYVSEYLPNLTQQQRLNGYANTTRNGCYSSFMNEHTFDTHPTYPARLERILLANPVSRRQIGCKKTADDLNYCSAND